MTDIRDGRPRAALLPAHYRTDYSPPELWCVVGTAYGYLHRTDGCIRVWRTRNGAARAARRYRSIWGVTNQETK